MLTNDQIASHLEGIARKLRGPENKISRHESFLARVWMVEEDVLNCSFCGKNQHQIENLIAGPGIYICNECAHVCAEMLLDDWGMELHLPFACVLEETNDHTSVVRKLPDPPPPRTRRQQEEENARSASSRLLAEGQENTDN